PEALAEEPVHEAALQQQLLELLALVAAALHLPPDLHDADEHDQVQDPDEPEERPRHRRPDHAADRLEGLEVALDGLGREGDREREAEDDRRVAEREEEPDPQRALALLHEEPGGVVDGRDVVGVEGVPKPEAVREGAGARVYAPEVVGVEKEEPPSQHVEEPDEPEEPAEARHLVAREAPVGPRAPGPVL